MKTTQKSRIRVIGYCRVSTTKQEEEGSSLSTQREKLENYARAYSDSLQIVDICEETGSAKSFVARPVLLGALERLEIGNADGLLVPKLDRLTRSVKDLGALIERYFERFTLVSVADSIDTRSASGRLVLNVLGSVSQWEREMIAERTREVLQHLKAQGKRLGQHPLEGPAVARMVMLDAAGASLREIVEVLVAEGFATKREGQWHAETVRQVLRRAKAVS